MDDTPRQFFEEFRSSILKRRIGQIALAVVLAEAIWRLVNAFTWFLAMPIVGRFFSGQTESVLFRRSANSPIALESFFGSVLEFLFTLIVVFYLNRWVMRRPAKPQPVEPEYSIVGEPQNLTEAPGAMEN